MANAGVKVIPVCAGAARTAEQKEIAELAFELWLARGFRGGSPVEDLFEAARTVRQEIPEPSATQRLFLVPKA